MILLSYFFQLGLVIDLTNTTRYYSVNDWKKEGIKYVKVSFQIHNYQLLDYEKVVVRLWFVFVLSYNYYMHLFLFLFLFYFYLIQLNCKGRGSVPENEAVNQFVYEACYFLHFI